ncbi:MAG: hypothetical protein PF961_08695 [Planctomycetota bacterium]|jgi:putative Mn2+ efflux pump MntP|nr:hypothetical protein [Planctomycetota bacterium]
MAFDPYSDDGDTTTRGMATFTILAGGLLAGWFINKIIEALQTDVNNPTAFAYLGFFVCFGVGMMVVGFKRHRDAGTPADDQAHDQEIATAHRSDDEAIANRPDDTAR